MASYYTEKGEAAGRWVGSGLAGLESIDAGDVVTEAHLLNLLGAGHHPLAEQLRAAAAEQGRDVRGQESAAWLGTPFRVYAGMSPRSGSRSPAGSASSAAAVA